MECRRCQELTAGTFPGSLICSKTNTQIAYNRIDKWRACETEERTTPLVVAGRVVFVPSGWKGPIDTTEEEAKPMISCDQCGAGFETAEEYKLHMKMSHQYVCTYCGKGFKSNKGRGVHEVKCKQRPKDQEGEKLVKEAKPEINLTEKTKKKSGTTEFDWREIQKLIGNCETCIHKKVCGRLAAAMESSWIACRDWLPKELVA